MTVNFKDALKIVLINEGGLTNNPHDRGGLTKYGITRKTLLDAISEGIVPRETTIKSLTKKLAADIYKDFYWDCVGLDRLNNQAIAAKVFDTSVNVGIYWGVVLLQRAIHAATGKAVKEDGVLGPKTLAALHNSPSNALLASCRSEQAGYYRCIVIKRPTQEVFIKGWLRRAYK